MTAGRVDKPDKDRIKRLTRHVVIPAIMPVVFFLVAFTPVAVLGCRNRGLLALLVALASGFLALGAAVAGVRGRARGDANASWWVVSSMVLTIPVVAMLAMA